MAAIVDARLPGVFAGFLPDAVELWRATTTRGAGGGRSQQWHFQARVLANLQPSSRLPLDTTAASEQTITALWNVYLAVTVDVRLGDVLRRTPSGQAVGATVTAAVFTAFPDVALRIDDPGGESYGVLRRALAREVTA